jgi:hypothetical protein
VEVKGERTIQEIPAAATPMWRRSVPYLRFGATFFSLSHPHCAARLLHRLISRYVRDANAPLVGS